MTPDFVSVNGKLKRVDLVVWHDAGQTISWLLDAQSQSGV